MTTPPHPRGEGERLGDRIVRAGLASREQIERAAAEARTSERRLGETLVDRYKIDQGEVYRHLAEQKGLRFTDVHEMLALADPDVIARVPRRFLERQRVIPITRENGRLVVATCDPDAHVPELAEAVRDVSGVEVRLVTPMDFRRLRVAFDLGMTRKTPTPSGSTSAHVHDLAIQDPRLDAHLVRIFDAILLDAIAERASDIHIEKYGERVRVRLRIDGDLHDARHFQITPEQHKGLINVVKVSAQLDISEQRLPQGGRYTTRASGHVFDLRVQTQPTLHGEHAVIRLLPQDTKLLGIEDLGFPPETARAYRRLLDVPSGLILVVGPTGSGKSTTLYAGLQVLANDATRKVITVEDPIEYAIEEIQQTTARPEIGFGFAHAMRSFVRQDPDVILVGEIRDGETALEAIRASQTGHLVLSTLHCNDAVDAVQRLFDLGLHPNSIASELIAVIAQRLAKRNCESCRTPTTPRPDVVNEIFPLGVPAELVFHKGAGCPRCSLVGTRGRIGIYEHLTVTPALRKGIAHHSALDELRGVALSEGLVPLRDQGLRHVMAGTIALEELYALLPPERLAPERR